MEKPIRNAVTVGSLVECFFTFLWLVHSTTSVYYLWPTQPSIRDEWKTCGSHFVPLEKGEERLIRSHLSLSFVAFAQMSCLVA